MSTPKRRGRIQKPGLWFSQTRAEVQDVTARMKKPCDHCERKPVERRLKLTHGSGRHATSTVLCQNCGVPWIEDFEVLAVRASRYLNGVKAVESIRLPKE